MEIFIWCAGATLLGFGLGYLGYFHSKLAYSIFATGMAVITFFSSQIVQLTGGDVSEMGPVVGSGILRSLMSSINTMGFLPLHVQIAILVFTVAFFASRIATWAYTSFGPKPAEETVAERKARVLASYGMKSMDDVRRLR